MKTSFSGAGSIFLILGIALVGCDAPTTGTTSSSGSGKTVSQLMTSHFVSRGWGNGGWSSKEQARHKCPEEIWFYTGIGNTRSLEELNTFANENGFTSSRTVATAQMVLSGTSIPEDLKHKAECLTTVSISDLR